MNSNDTQLQLSGYKLGLLKKAYDEFIADLAAIEKRRDEKIAEIMKLIDEKKLAEARTDLKNIK